MLMMFLLVLQLLLLVRGMLGGLWPTGTWRAHEFRQLPDMARCVLGDAVRVRGKLRDFAFQFVGDRLQMLGQVGDLLSDAAVWHAPFRVQSKVGIEPYKRDQRAKGILLGIPAGEIPTHDTPNVGSLLAADRGNQPEQVLGMGQ